MKVKTKAIKLSISPHEGYIAISLTVLDVSNQTFHQSYGNKIPLLSPSPFAASFWNQRYQDVERLLSRYFYQR